MDHAINPDDSVPTRQRNDWLVLGGVALLVALAWWTARRGLIRSGDDAGYWLGVVGASMMLLLFVYPLRKHLRFAKNWGAMKGWLYVHMLLGVLGPFFILVHSTFHLGSINATVAFYSMLLVAGSGVIGRFLYVRVNQDAGSALRKLQALQAKLELARTKFDGVLGIQDILQEQSQRMQQIRGSVDAIAVLWHLLIHQYALSRRLRERCARAQPLGYDSADPEAQHRRTKLTALVAKLWAAQVLTTRQRCYERLLSLWHVAHIPFVYLLIITAIVHVVAVHAY